MNSERRHFLKQAALWSVSAAIVPFMPEKKPKATPTSVPTQKFVPADAWVKKVVEGIRPDVGCIIVSTIVGTVSLEVLTGIPHKVVIGILKRLFPEPAPRTQTTQDSGEAEHIGSFKVLELDPDYPKSTPAEEAHYKEQKEENEERQRDIEREVWGKGV